MKKKIAIVGAGDLGQLIAYHAHASGTYSVAGYYDDTIPKGTEVEGHIVLGMLKDIEAGHRGSLYDGIIIGIGYKHLKLRGQLFDGLYGSVPFLSVMHKSLVTGGNNLIGDGVLILPGCVLDKGVSIANNVVLNTGCVVAHDSAVAEHSFLGPGVNAAGFVKIGKRCFIGINSTIIDNINIVNDVRTGGGAVIVDNISEPGLYVGSPAKKIKD